MDEKGQVMLRVMMNRFHKSGSQEALLNCLSPDQAEKILAQTTQSTSVEDALKQPRELLKRIHYSWLKEAVQKMPDSLQPYVLSALPKGQSKGLYKLLEREPKDLEMSSIIRTFLMNLLSKEMGAHEVLPPSFLPEDSLVILLELDKKQLLDLVDLMGIYDLANEYKQIIHKEKLKLIISCLSERKQRFLKNVLQQQDKFVQEKLGIEQFGGKKETLDKILHRRGIIRFARGLSGCHPHMLWHIKHTLDIGRSAILEKHWIKETTPIITPAIRQQITQVLNFMKIKPKEKL